MHETRKVEDLLALVEEKRFRELKAILGEMNEVDIAEFVGELDPEKLVLVFRLLPRELAAEVFTYLEDSEDQERLINALSDRELREFLDELYLDDTVDIIEDMPANVVSRILRNQINQLLNYPKDSAGSLMTTEFVYLHPQATVEESFARIRKVGLDKETVYTCYVTEHRVLVGVVTVKRLLLSPYETRIEDIMESNVLSVNTHEDKEDVAQMFSKYDLTALPVVDGEDRLVGIITVDDAMDVMEEEATEDIEKMAAIVPTDKPYFQTGVIETWKHRVPWLLLLMVSATFTGTILGVFESALAANAALTLFIPMLMDTGGNSGGQASVTLIRAMSLGDVEFRDIFKVIWKELRVSFLCAATLGAVVFAKVIFIDQKGPLVALVVAVSIFLTIVIAKLVGCTLPMLAKKLGFDPAVMASPFITTVVDALSLLVYFAVATSLLGL